VFTAAGVAGAFAGASLGKQLDGTELLALFGLVMIAIGVYMLTFKPKLTVHDVKLTRENAAHLLPRLPAIGAGVGLLSGFFGIGGGFLIVPGLVLATGMALQNAIGNLALRRHHLWARYGHKLHLIGPGRLAARGTGYRRGHCRHPHWHPRQCPARRSQTSSCRHFRERGDRRGALRRCERGHETPHLRLGLPRPAQISPSRWIFPHCRLRREA
jgi:sulfite exporter TauE/SafE